MPEARGARSGARRSRWSSRTRSSLNPVFPVGDQIAEMFRKHRGMNKADARTRRSG